MGPVVGFIWTETADDILNSKGRYCTKIMKSADTHE